jgi:hypothetical protein
MLGSQLPNDTSSRATGSGWYRRASSWAEHRSAITLASGWPIEFA